MRQHRRPERHWIVACRPVALALKPGEQIAIRRREAGPKQLDLLCGLVANRARRRVAGCADRACGLAVHERHHLGRITFPCYRDLSEASIGFIQIAFGQLYS